MTTNASITTTATILDGLPPLTARAEREAYVDARVRRLGETASHALSDHLAAYDHARIGCSRARSSLMAAARAQIDAAAGEVLTYAEIARQLTTCGVPDVAQAALARAADLRDTAEVAAQTSALPR